MINLQLTVREAFELSNNCSREIYEKILNSFEIALGVNQSRTVTITDGMNLNNRIHCIKTIRHYTGWGLKESKDWTDVLVGSCTKNSITLSTPEAAENLLRDLVDKGCEGYLS